MIRTLKKAYAAPNVLFQQAIRLARKVSLPATYDVMLAAITQQHSHFGLDRGKLSLTFDCDIEQDSVAADTVREQLARLNIQSSWAVIGEWVRRFPEVYRRLLGSGHELLNHTLSHPSNQILRPIDNRKFADVSSAERRSEILGCHELVRRLLGYEMRGFRAPHFSMTNDVYKILAELGYIYSSSRLYNVGPFVGGVHLTREGIAELPLFGPPVPPFLVPATYSLYRAPKRLYKGEQDFYEQFKALLEITRQRKLVTVIYFDPCDVVCLRQPNFETYLRTALDSGLELCRMDEIARWLRERCCQPAT